MIREYTVDIQMNIFGTHYIISLSEDNYWTSYREKSMTCHEYRGAGDSAKVRVFASSLISGEFLTLLLTRAYQDGSRVVVIPIERINDLSLEFVIFADERVSVISKKQLNPMKKR